MRSPIIRSAHLYTIHLFFRDGLTAHQRLTLVSHTWQGPFDHHTSFPPPSCCATALSRQREAARYMYGCDKAYKPYTFFAGAAYCQPSTTMNWDCGSLCAGNSDFIPIASGGDGDDVQFWYVGYSPSLSTVIVAHQGTDVTEIESLLTDIDFLHTNLDPDLFPGLDSHIKVHNGFKETHEKTAEDILRAVTTALSDHSANSVSLVGHSLGAALSLLDAVYLPLQLPNATFRMVGYGMPRVGNQEFADYVDSALAGNLTRINNKQDFIPTLPPRLLGFHHPSGEIHINDTDWNSCSGQENSSDECTDGAVKTILSGDVFDHTGPYDGITIRC